MAGRTLLPDALRAPKTYFHPSGSRPVFGVVDGPNAAAQRRRHRPGRGNAGVLRAPDQRWTFYEIDPLVEQVARDPKLFTFLANSRGAVSVSIGDGRLKLQHAPAARTT